MSETGRLIADLVEGLLADSVDADMLARAEDGAVPADLWAALEANGLTAMLAEGPEAEIGWREAFIVVAAAGRHCLPLPLAESIGATALLAMAGLDVPEGPVAIATRGPDDRLALRRHADGWRADGAIARIPWGRFARHVVVDAAHEGKARIARIALEHGRLDPGVNLVGEPRDLVVFHDAAAEIADPPPIFGDHAVELVGAMLRAGQMAGAIDAVLRQSIAYAGERRQFGRPIGGFQAVQHMLAQLAEESAAATMAAEQAFVAVDAGRDVGFAVATAKLRAGEAAGRAAAIAHEVHGAMGFAREHPLHHATRRLMAWRAEFGAEAVWARRLATMVIPQGGDGLWPFLTDAQTDASEKDIPP
jgi:acyl-CoA dehydrogenase